MEEKHILLIILVFALTSISNIALNNIASAEAKSRFVGVIATLEPVYQLGDWNLFKQQLELLNESGVSVISSDVWWDHFQPSENTWDWSYYRDYVIAVNESGFKWLPIVSLHSVPKWILQNYPDAKFVNQNNESSEMYLSYWHPQTKPLIASALTEFFKFFRNYSQATYCVCISTGMWGELQYPWMLRDDVIRKDYYGYDNNAKIDFRQKMQAKYVTMQNANANWGTNFTDWNSIDPPFSNTSNLSMWNDFLGWYNSTLVEFEDWILNMTRQQYGGDISIKISMDPNPEYDAMLGHLDYNAIFHTAAKYSAIPTCTAVEIEQTASKFANASKNYNLTHWAENSVEDANLTVVQSNLEKYDFNAFFYLRMTELFDKHATTNIPTYRYCELKNLIQAFIPEIIPEFPSFLTLTLFIAATLISVALHKSKRRLHICLRNASKRAHSRLCIGSSLALLFVNVKFWG